MSESSVICPLICLITLHSNNSHEMSKMNAVQDKNANVQALNIMFFKTL